MHTIPPGPGRRCKSDICYIEIRPYFVVIECTQACFATSSTRTAYRCSLVLVASTQSVVGVARSKIPRILEFLGPARGAYPWTWPNRINHPGTFTLTAKTLSATRANVYPCSVGTSSWDCSCWDLSDKALGSCVSDIGGAVLCWL